MRVERISAVTLTVASMRNAVRFYGDVLGMEMVYGGENGYFSSLRVKETNARVIFYVADVDAFWEYLRGLGFHPELPRDASWGERYFHMSDPEGHELSFARPI